MREVYLEGRIWAAVVLDAALLNLNPFGQAESLAVFVHPVSWCAVLCPAVQGMPPDFPGQ